MGPNEAGARFLLFRPDTLVLRLLSGSIKTGSPPKNFTSLLIVTPQNYAVNPAAKKKFSTAAAGPVENFLRQITTKEGVRFFLKKENSCGAQNFLRVFSCLKILTAAPAARSLHAPLTVT